MPAFLTLIVTESPDFTFISGLFPASPGSALNASVLKSELSTKFRSKETLFPVGGAA